MSMHPAPSDQPRRSHAGMIGYIPKSASSVNRVTVYDPVNMHNSLHEPAVTPSITGAIAAAAADLLISNNSVQLELEEATMAYIW